MLKLLGSLCVVSGGALAWYFQRAERRRERNTRLDFQRAFRRMSEEVRMARTPLPVLLRALAGDCGEPAAVFFEAVSRAAAENHRAAARFSSSGRVRSASPALFASV